MEGTGRRNGSASVPGVDGDSGQAHLGTRVRVSVILPALNEARNLPHVLRRLPEGIHELVLVDGHSKDGTAAVARSLYPAVKLVCQDGWGKGNALACGFRAATGAIIVTLDADGSTDPAEIPRFVHALESGADYAKGSRFAHGGGSEDITRLRRAGNWALTRLVNLLFRTNYADLCYGYNAFWAYLKDDLAEGASGFEIETAMNVRVAKAGLKVVEVPSVERHRLHGLSNLNTFRDGWRVLKTIFRERFTRDSFERELPAVLQADAVRAAGRVARTSEPAS